MLRHALAAFLLAVGTTAGNGAGAWLDPKHQSDESPLAGMRFVAESPPHHLTLVGTDDGKTWYTLKGTCSGPSMTKIMFDFSPKGGPKDLTGTYSANRKVRPLPSHPTHLIPYPHTQPNTSELTPSPAAGESESCAATPPLALRT